MSTYNQNNEVEPDQIISKKKSDNTVEEKLSIFKHIRRGVKI
jgi:hypothetical protein